MSAVTFLKNLSKITKEDLENVKGFGPILIQNLLDFTQSTRFQTVLQKFSELESKNINIDIQTNFSSAGSGILTGENICITGSFDKSREELKKILISLGANVVDTVTKKTTILLVGADAGSKLDKAKALNIKIINSIEELI